MIQRFDRTGPGWTCVRALLIALSSVAIVVAAIVVRVGDARWTAGSVALTAESPARIIVVGALSLACVLLIGAGRRWVRRWTAAAGFMLIVVGLLDRGGATGWPAGDSALIELMVIQALRGQQLVGAYSQYGWHHPGPLPFYWLAPFYWLSRLSSTGLAIGALTANLLSLAIVAQTIGRKAMSQLVAFALSAAFVAYAWRVPGLLDSAWNPHLPMLPFAALLFVSARVAAEGATPWRAALQTVLATFIVQAHIGYAVAVAAVVLISALAAAARAWRQPALRSRSWTALALAVAIAELLWFLPFAEQLSEKPGNISRILTFFFSGNEGQPFALAWRAWGSMLVAAFSSGLRLARGQVYDVPASLIPALLGTAIVIALVPIAVMARRRGDRLTTWLAAMCEIASLAGLYSTISVRGPIGDYHIFWLSLVGAINAALVVGVAVAVARDAWDDTLARWLPVSAGAVLIVAVGIIGIRPFVGDTNDRPLDAESADVRRLTQQLRAEWPGGGFQHPLLSIGQNSWSVGAGVLLQLQRDGVDVSVGQEVVWLVGPSQGADGKEDELLTISRAGEHDVLSQRAGNRLFARTDTYFVDGISLIDHPELRPR